MNEALLKILTDKTLEKEMGRKSKEIHRGKIKGNLNMSKYFIKRGPIRCIPIY
jgi:hypothetical protein